MKGLDKDLTELHNLPAPVKKYLMVMIMQGALEVQEYKTELVLYVLPDPYNDNDDPAKYALSIDNIYKVGYFSY